MEICWMTLYSRQWNMVYWKLLLMTSFTVIKASRPEKADIFECPRKNLTLLAAGQRIQLCCQLSRCQYISEGDKLTLAPRTLINVVCENESGDCSNRISKAASNQGWNITRTDGCHVMFEGILENYSKDHEEMYVCFKNDSFRRPFRVEKLLVLAKPSAPRILKLICSEKNDIIVILDKNSSSADDPKIEYTVTLTQYERITILCSTNCTIPPSNYSNICLCRYKNRTIDFHYGDVNVTVNISRRSQNFSITSEMTTNEFNLYRHIRPTKVDELFCQNVTSNDATVIFSPSQSILYKVSSMHKYGKHLQYYVTLIKTQGLLEVYKIKVDKTIYNHTHSNKYIGIRFRNLTAFTKYHFSVSGMGGGGMGPTSKLEFTTNKSVPLHPPSIEDFSYMKKPDGQSSGLFLLWQPLPQESRGGETLTYDLQITFQNRSTYNEKNLSLNYKHINIALPFDAFTVQLWAVNEIGRSVNFSKITIPSNNGVIQPSMYVEFENSSAHIYINLTNTNGVEMLAMHRCERTKDICREYPFTQIERINPTKKSFQFFTFKMKILLPENSTIRTLFKEFEYFEFIDKQKPLENVQIINGTITIGQVNLGPADVDIFDEHSYLSVDSWIERELSGVNQTDWPIKQPTYNKANNITGLTPVVHPSFFLSVKVKGFWMGMVAADCYFDRNLDNAKLTMIPLKNNMYLRLNQECDLDPTQFLVGSYKISSSDDEHCKKTNPETHVIENKNMFLSTLFKLPENMSLGFCVEAVGLNRTRKTGPHFIQYSVMTHSANRETVQIIATAITILLLIPGFIGLCLFQRCKKRKRHFHNIATFINETHQRKGERMRDRNDNGLMNQMVIHSPMESRDSGHGTIDSCNNYEMKTVFLNKDGETSEDIGLSEETKLLHSPVDSGLSCLYNEHDKSRLYSNHTQMDDPYLTDAEFSCSDDHTTRSSLPGLRGLKAASHRSITQEHPQNYSQTSSVGDSSDNSRNTVSSNDNLSNSTSASSENLSKSTSSGESKLNKYWTFGDLTFRPPTED